LTVPFSNVERLASQKRSEAFNVLKSVTLCVSYRAALQRGALHERCAGFLLVRILLVRILLVCIFLVCILLVCILLVCILLVCILLVRTVLRGKVSPSSEGDKGSAP